MSKFAKDFMRQLERLKKACAAGWHEKLIEEQVQAREHVKAEYLPDEPDCDAAAYLAYRYRTPYERTEDFLRLYRQKYKIEFERWNGRKVNRPGFCRHLQA